MQFLVAGFGIFLILYTGCMVKGKENNLCYQAKICIHNAKEKCGVSGDGTFRRFFDSCDIKEYNCLNNADFAKTDINKCSRLPPIEESGGDANTNSETKLRNGKPEDVKPKLNASP